MYNIFTRYVYVRIYYRRSLFTDDNTIYKQKKNSREVGNEVPFTYLKLILKFQIHMISYILCICRYILYI